MQLLSLGRELRYCKVIILSRRLPKVQRLVPVISIHTQHAMIWKWTSSAFNYQMSSVSEKASWTIQSRQCWCSCSFLWYLTISGVKKLAFFKLGESNLAATLKLLHCHLPVNIVVYCGGWVARTKIVGIFNRVFHGNDSLATRIWVWFEFTQKGTWAFLVMDKILQLQCPYADRLYRRFHWMTFF
jgi:hypothetical protein